MIHPLRILCFHRVVEALRDRDWPWRLRGTILTAGEFRSILLNLSKQFQFVDEATVTAVLTTFAYNKMTRPMCWVTFDDGYRDNLTVAAPIVAEFGIRPTLFVTTGILDPGWRLPVDRWYNTIVNARRPAVVIGTPDSPYIVDLRTMYGRKRMVDGPEKRIFINASPAEQQFILAKLGTLLDEEPNTSGPQYLDVDDLRELDKRGWTIGPHGHRHRILTEIPNMEVEAEVVTSAQTLLTHRLATSCWFAYANGAVNEPVTNSVSRLLVPRGYVGALTVTRHDVMNPVDLWQIPRHIVSPKTSSSEFVRNPD